MNEHLSIFGMVFIIFTWIAIIGLNVFCFIRIFRDRTKDIPDQILTIDEDGKNTV